MALFWLGKLWPYSHFCYFTVLRYWGSLFLVLVIARFSILFLPTRFLGDQTFFRRWFRQIPWFFVFERQNVKKVNFFRVWEIGLKMDNSRRLSLEGEKVCHFAAWIFFQALFDYNPRSHFKGHISCKVQQVIRLFFIHNVGQGCCTAWSLQKWRWFATLSLVIFKLRRICVIFALRLRICLRLARTWSAICKSISALAILTAKKIHHLNSVTIYYKKQ